MTCDHGLHQKYKIQGVGFVCIGCDPTWVPVTADDAWPFSLLVHRSDTESTVEAEHVQALPDHGTDATT